MKIKIVNVIDVPCRGCGKMEVRHHAKGKCNNCYHAELKAVDKAKEKATT